MSAALRRLVGAVEEALADDSGPGDEVARAQRMVPAMQHLLADPAPLPAWAYEPFDGQAVGNVVHVDVDGRFHVMAVVFPEGTSSGVHHHGCWGVIGYLRGGDEETRYLDPHTETSREVWRQGDVTLLVSEDSPDFVRVRGRGGHDRGQSRVGAASVAERGHGVWHRVRNPGPGTAVSLHVLCRAPADHPHQLWDRDQAEIVPYPFVEVAPGRWRAAVGDTG